MFSFSFFVKKIISLIICFYSTIGSTISHNYSSVLSSLSSLPPNTIQAANVSSYRFSARRFPAEHIPAFTPYTLHFTPYSTGILDERTVRPRGGHCPCTHRSNRSTRSTRGPGSPCRENSTSTCRGCLRRRTNFRCGSLPQAGR